MLPTLKTKLLPSFLLYLALCPVGMLAQGSLLDRIQEVEIQEIILECEFDSLIANKNSGEYMDGVFIFQRPSGESERWNARFRARGKFRRRICNMPPLKVDFDKDELEAAGLERYDEFKIVTHCLIDEFSQDRVVKEYLAYKMYQLLSPYTYRVQLARIQYVDLTQGTNERYWGFLIEDNKEIRDRLQMSKVDSFNLAPELFPAEHLTKIALFQYLIGNSDWSFESNRNIEVVRSGEDFYLLPFDFDFSGFVNAPYAIPNPDFKLASVRDRVYLGPTPTDQAMQKAQHAILSQKKEILRLVRRCKYLDYDQKQEALFYLRDGFKEIRRGEIRFPGQIDRD
jgi:hypothetical protein